ncbi:ribosome small subunit-dependent GTPase A [Archangium lansingense]|uniref:Small ribosomal subunit biogenesis GTPase RsgA n=1 Tax=Archangium lansingense TaxID=2995310 RepID=A0ABT3ZZ73_9BACT|nr:ribosome small subunit-dependent GTPase A [Archangium lansinium]MCY1074698.1 ribosome small subunit-dependent GTPase A [Archangium lansinium]
MSMDEHVLEKLGWGPPFQEAWRSRASDVEEPARIGADFGVEYVLYSARGDMRATIPGRLRMAIRKGQSVRPVVGDWVSFEPRIQEGTSIIQAVLPRRTQLVRKAAGRADEEQVVAANVDVVFLVSALTRDLNPRRLERYLTVAWDSGAQPVLVLTKSDLCEDLVAARERIATLAPDVPLHTVSSLTGEGLDAIWQYIGGNRTVALIGSSGVGKSTLINRLVGSARMEVGAVREDDKGRHTTTHRELFVLPQGGLVIDTPGMRELGLMESEEGVRTAFVDIEELSAGCRFSDCRHEKEPGCAVREALRSGQLAPERLESYRKLVQEVVRPKQDTRKTTRALNDFQKKRGR